MATGYNQNSAGAPLARRPKRQVFAPQVNTETLQKLDEIMSFFTIDERRTRIDRAAELMQNLWAGLVHFYGPRAHAGMIIAYLLDEYAPSTARNYAITMQQVEPRLKLNSDWRLAYRKLERWAADAQNRPEGAVPATPDQVRALIGDLSTPHQRAIFQLWVSASRYSESRGYTDALYTGFGVHTPMTWYLRRWGQFNVIELYLPIHKGAPDGERPYSKWIQLPALHRDRVAQAWSPHHIEYQSLLHYVKTICPTLSLHSFRQGAQQLLQRMGISPTRIKFLSGHQPITKVPSLNKSYHVSDPRQHGAQQVMRLTSLLQQAIGL